MANANTIYKCEICGNIVSVIHNGPGELVCCGEPMNELNSKDIDDEGKEKHIPIIEIGGNKVLVKVGSVPHPMEESHYISLIQILKDGKVITGKRLYPDDAPEVEFILGNTEGIKARALCNIHGLWMN